MKEKVGKYLREEGRLGIIEVAEPKKSTTWGSDDECEVVLRLGTENIAKCLV